MKILKKLMLLTLCTTLVLSSSTSTVKASSTPGFGFNPWITDEVITSIQSINTGIGTKGYNPSSGNPMLIQATIDVPTYWNLDTRLRLRILDSKGKYVFQKSFKNIGTGLFSYKWSGKASKNNKAKVTANAFVKKGKYKVELYLYSGSKEYKDIVKSSKKTKSFKVSKSAPKGSQAFLNRKNIPIYTGYANIDYMAEKMIKSAGITSGMNQDEKVRRIYNYMTYNFKHIHSDVFYTQSDKYNLKKASKKIKALKKESDEKLSKNKLLYSYQYQSYEQHMQKRCGECNTSASVFALLCNHVGIDAGVCSGYYVNRNGTKMGHYWNYAVVNGVTYYYDVDVEIQNFGKGQGDYYWYKKTYAESTLTHEYN